MQFKKLPKRSWVRKVAGQSLLPPGVEEDDEIHEIKGREFHMDY